MEGSAAPPPPQQRFQGVQKESAGYRLLASEPHHSFGHDLVGETWELNLD